MVRNFTVIKIIENSFRTHVFNKQSPTPLGRWKACGNDDLKTLYANTDHCGDVICGNPEILKNQYKNKRVY
jgi:hypothetical protein